MTAKDFCLHHGFTVISEEVDGRFLIHVRDANRRIFPKGERRGKIRIRQERLEDHIKNAYQRMMDMILDKIYK
ncbi:MAG: hypothetical protein AB3N16_07905 [Flavobacteriaceae bacterium]